MSIDSKHPLYSELHEDWVVMRDFYKGEKQVKSKGEIYLPSTSGMRMDGMGSTQSGYKAYQAYKMRAIVPDSVRESVEILIGLLHQKPANISLPAGMENMREHASADGESLQDLLRRINEEQLITGRLGLLADVAKNPSPDKPLTYIAFYNAESIINWDDADQTTDGFNTLNLVVLDETGDVREGFTWTRKEKHRVLQLGDFAKNEIANGIYSAGVFEESQFDEESMRTPMIRGTALKSIPFVFVNSKDTFATPDDAPLMGLARVVLAIYRGEADYRQSLFMQGQDTLVIVGTSFDPETGTSKDTSQPLRTGAGARIELEVGGNASYIGVSSTGLQEQRMALEADYRRADTRTGRLMNAKSNRESGEALKTRLAAQTATLNQIALTGAAGLQKLLRIVAEWQGFNPEEVIVKPNLEFADFNLSGQDILNIMQARAMGFPVSQQSLHRLAVDRGITELDLVTELQLIESEEPLKSQTEGEPNDEQPTEPGMAGKTTEEE